MNKSAHKHRIMVFTRTDFEITCNIMQIHTLRTAKTDHPSEKQPFTG
jgi:hypothetical protein